MSWTKIISNRLSMGKKQLLEDEAGPQKKLDRPLSLRLQQGLTRIASGRMATPSIGRRRFNSETSKTTHGSSISKRSEMSKTGSFITSAGSKDDLLMKNLVFSPDMKTLHRIIRNEETREQLINSVLGVQGNLAASIRFVACVDKCEALRKQEFVKKMKSIAKLFLHSNSIFYVELSPTTAKRILQQSRYEYVWVARHEILESLLSEALVRDFIKMPALAHMSMMDDEDEEGDFVGFLEEKEEEDEEEDESVVRKVNMPSDLTVNMLVDDLLPAAEEHDLMEDGPFEFCNPSGRDQ